MNRIRPLSASLLLVTFAWSLSGCGGSGENPELLAQRNKYTLDAPPAGAVGIVDAKQQLADAESDEGDVVLVAKVGAGEHDTWQPGKAVFAVSEILEDDPAHGGEGHDPSTCPFCKRRQSLVDMRAIVQLVDEQGEVLAIDARKLLPVEENQQVMVRGRGRVDELGNLVVDANGVYIKR